ncbi:MAG: OmpA family protein [Saprospiraceae bacterium]|nr:OmpA family protein [Saprospiraceae bacterium]
MRSFLIALLALLWLILGWLYYQEYNKCCTTKGEISVLPAAKGKTGPILFAWGNSIPILSDSWPAMRDSLTRFASDTTSLEIIGYFCNNALPEESESLGFKRASETRNLFTGIDNERIILLSKGIDCDSSSRLGPFESVGFNVRKRTENIKEIDDRTLIYFLPNSTQKLNSTEVEGYLTDVAIRVKKTGEKIQLTGHTDAVGPASDNLKLGQQRADIVKNFLVSQGVSPQNIISTSKGEEVPIEDNSTPSGRAKNRRTELQIIK